MMVFYNDLVNVICGTDQFMGYIFQWKKCKGDVSFFVSISLIGQYNFAKKAIIRVELTKVDIQLKKSCMSVHVQCVRWINPTLDFNPRLLVFVIWLVFQSKQVLSSNTLTYSTINSFIMKQRSHSKSKWATESGYQLQCLDSNGSIIFEHSYYACVCLQRFVIVLLWNGQNLTILLAYIKNPQFHDSIRVLEMVQVCILHMVLQRNFASKCL